MRHLQLVKPRPLRYRTEERTAAPRVGSTRAEETFTIAGVVADVADAHGPQINISDHPGG
jgi:hypothetical protein